MTSFLSKLFGSKPANPAANSPSARSAPRPSAPAFTPVLPPADTDREARILALGGELLTKARAHKAGLLSSQFYSDALMEWSMKDPNFKVQMFRFVDCFPQLKTPDQIFDHLNDYLTQPGVTVPTVIATALKAGGLMKGLAAGQIEKQITGMASRFIAGTDAKSALPGLKKMWDDGIAFSVDLLGETCVSDLEADHFCKKYLDLIENLPAAVAQWKPQPSLESDHLGAIPRVNVSIKISALSARVDPIDTEGSIRELMKRLVPILEVAHAKGVFVNFDMEHHQFKDLTLELFRRCCEKVPFEAGLAMQAYLKSGVDDAKAMCEWAIRAKRIVTVRLVKGAYWDAETIKSEMHGWPCPVWPVKWQTDACFEAMTDVFLDACPRPGGTALQSGVSSGGTALQSGGIKLALGSHNARSIGSALSALEKRGLPRNALELQMLHGMADQLKYAAADMGLRIREYVPVGDMIPGMAYLVRRLLENTSNESWLKAGFLDNADPAALLARPGSTPGAKPIDLLEVAPERHALSPAVPGVGDSRAFVTEPMRDFADAFARDAFAKAVASARVPTVANDRTVEQAAEMVKRAEAAFPMWRDADPIKRADVLVRAAAIMRARRDELSAIMIKEAGKTWREADADTCEAIDFCDYYARASVPLFVRERLGRFIGELDEQFYQPKGVAVVISPWNFPLAICCGMAVAALVTGNTVIIKPAEQTPGIAKVMFDILQEAARSAFGGTALQSGVSLSDILHLCPAPGETVGAALVRDPRVALIAFTGSRDVGLDIMNGTAPNSPFAQKTAKPEAHGFQPVGIPTHPTHLKHVICEMGGKNALIIDTSADWDEAVLAARQSAFGFQGQKCSACSRLIVVDPEGPTGPAITGFRERLVEATKALVIGDPTQPGTDVGPVIDADAANKINGFIERAKASGLSSVSLPLPDTSSLRNSVSPSLPPLPFVSPHIFWTVPESHELAREEIFGPVLAIMHAKDFDDALRIANSLPYKLTGGVFTRKPANLEKAKREFRVGNLYLNRGITGALVARQPFGGFAMSGGGSKAGGKDYLLHFVDPRLTCENTLRRGFAPEL